MAKTFDPSERSFNTPTREAGTYGAVFDSFDNIHSEANKRVRGWGVKVEGGGERWWITRLSSFETYSHVAVECLELSREPQEPAWEEGCGLDEPVEGSSFWPIVSNEFYARAYCMGLEPARVLMRAIEAEWTDPASEHGLAMREEMEDPPLQVYLHEFAQEGLAIVHVAHMDVLQEGGLIFELEAGLEKRAPGLLASARVFDSCDFFGTYDNYCTDSFIEQTGEAWALAAWSHGLPAFKALVEKPGRKFGQFQALLRVRAEREQLEQAAGLGEPKPATPRI